MTKIDFHPERRTIEDLFMGADYFVIPRFQRPYSWESSNLDDFWRDVVFDNAVGYFIGPMVAWREPNKPIRRVVDGQQRLTTISILFAVLRDQFSDLGKAQLAEGMHRYLEKANRNNERQFTLQTEVASSFLSQAIFAYPPEQGVLPSTEEEIAISKAHDDIKRRVKEEVGKRSSPLKWLRELRDKLLGLRVIWIEHTNENDAYVLFETLNSRGKDLEVVDLLKNHLLSRLRGTGNPASDSWKTKWDKMRNQLDATDTRSRIDANRFILHWWLSKEEYVGERKLFPAIKDKIKSKPMAVVALDSLASDAKTYSAIVDPDSRKWPSEEEDGRRALHALSIFGITQPFPLLLSLLRARSDSEKLSASQFRRTLLVVERFHFQHTIVSQLRSSGGVSEMYAKAARELHSVGTDPQRRADVLDEIRRKLVERAPDRDQFILAFENRFHLTDSRSRESKLVKYVLEGFLREASPSTSTQNLTVEHVMSQSQHRTGDAVEKVVGSIGNLLLVTEPINTALGDKDFASKRRILDQRARAYDIGGILECESWTATEIAERTALLAIRAYDKIWKLPV